MAGVALLGVSTILVPLAQSFTSDLILGDTLAAVTTGLLVG